MVKDRSTIEWSWLHVLTSWFNNFVSLDKLFTCSNPHIPPWSGEYNAIYLTVGMWGWEMLSAVSNILSSLKMWITLKKWQWLKGPRVMASESHRGVLWEKLKQMSKEAPNPSERSLKCGPSLCGWLPQIFPFTWEWYLPYLICFQVSGHYFKWIDGSII